MIDYNTTYLMFFLWMFADYLDLFLLGTGKVVRFLIFIFYALSFIRTNSNHIIFLLSTALIGITFFLTSYSPDSSDYTIRFSIVIIFTCVLYSNLVDIDVENLYRLLTLTNYFIFMSVVLGLLLGLSVYDGSDGRFGGSKGLSESTNQLSYFVILVFSSNLLYLQYLKYRCAHISISKYSRALLPIICALLLTTKVSTIGILVIALAYLFANACRMTFVIMIVAAVLLFVFFNEFISSLSNISSFARIIDYLEDSTDVVDLLTSGRWTRLVDNLDSITNFQAIIPFRVEHLNFESDPFDVWYNSGLVGALLIVYIFTKVIVTLRLKDPVVFSTVTIIVLSSLMAGHFLTAIIAAPVLAIFGVFAQKGIMLSNKTITPT